MKRKGIKIKRDLNINEKKENIKDKIQYYKYKGFGHVMNKV